MKDEEKDRIVWQEYLANVLKKRGAEWRPLFMPPARSTTRELANPRLRRPPSLADGAWQLRAYLDRMRPDVVLIEGLDDATALIPDITRKETQPPIAILAYTDSLPVRTLVYPVRRYSPEYQAICWAQENKAPVEFIDLPSDIFLGLQDVEIRTAARSARGARTGRDGRRSSAADRRSGSTARRAAVPASEPSLYEQFADLAGERDYDTYWERHFEHNTGDDSYRGRRSNSAGRCANWKRTRRAGGPRTSSAKPSCAAGSRKRSPPGTSRSRSSPWSARFMRRC